MAYPEDFLIKPCKVRFFNTRSADPARSHDVGTWKIKDGESLEDAARSAMAHGFIPYELATRVQTVEPFLIKEEVTA